MRCGGVGRGLPLHPATLVVLLYCAQTARRARLVALVPKNDDRWGTAPPPATIAPGEATVLDYAGSSFFAELPRIETQLPSPGSVHGAVLALVVRALCCAYRDPPTRMATPAPGSALPSRSAGNEAGSEPPRQSPVELRPLACRPRE